MNFENRESSQGIFVIADELPISPEPQVDDNVTLRTPDTRVQVKIVKVEGLRYVGEVVGFLPAAIEHGRIRIGGLVDFTQLQVIALSR